MSENIKTQSIPSRIKVDWSTRTSQELHFNNSNVIRRTTHSGENVFGHSLDSKLNSLVVNKQEFYDVVEDGRPLLPREHSTQNPTQVAKTSETPYTNSSISPASQNETKLSKNLSSSFGRKPDTNNPGFRKQYENAPFSRSLDSCKSSYIGVDEKTEFTFTSIKQQSPEGKNGEVGEKVDSVVPEKHKTEHALNTKEMKYSEVISNGLNNENKVFEEENPSSTADSDPVLQSDSMKSHLRSKNKDDYDEGRQDWMFPGFTPEIPPLPPQSYSHRCINRFKSWNGRQWLKTKSQLPRVINMTIYCGNRSKYYSRSNFSSAKGRADTKSADEFPDPAFDLGFDPDLLSESLSVNKSDSGEEDEHMDAWNDNHAYNPARQKVNSGSSFESDFESIDSDVFDIQSYSETGISVNSTAFCGMEQDKRCANESVGSHNFTTGKGKHKSATNNSFSSQQKVNPDCVPCASSNNSWSARLSTDTIKTSTVLNNQDSPEYDAHNDVQGVQREYDSSNVGKTEYLNTYTQEQKSRTFEEEANTPWAMKTDQVETSSSTHKPQDKELHSNWNTIPDQIQKIPISSKTLPLPHSQKTRELDQWDSTAIQTQSIFSDNIDYNYDGYTGHDHRNTDPKKVPDEEGKHHMPSESERFAEPVVSTKRTCYFCNGHGNCVNCKAMEMMDTMKTLSESAGFIIHDVLPDGNCMFRSIVDQLRMHGDHDTTAGVLRIRAVEYLTNNPCSEDGTHMKDFLLTETWEQYLARMKKDGEWGDEIALRGISEVLQRKICIISAVGKQHNQITIQPSNTDIDESENLFLGHLNDSHYLSLRPNNWLEFWFNNSRKVKHMKKSKAHSSEQEGVDHEKTAPEFESMLDLNEESENSLLEHNEGIDKLSMCPLQHLTFVIKNVLNAKYLVPTQWGPYRNVDNIARKRGTALKPTSIGIASEGLAVTIYDKFGIRSVKQNQKLLMPTLLVVFPYYLISSRGQANTDFDIITNDEDVHQGYLRLQPASDKLISTIRNHISWERNDTAFLKQSMLDTDSDETKIYGDWSHDNNKNSSSVASCFKCNFWPEATSEWFSRKRPSGWPIPNRREQAINTACLVVSEAHPLSTNPQIEFMYVFGEAEKILTRTFLVSQRYCFHVFRLIVEFITKDIPYLTTYHIKTIFLYASEIVPRNYWKLHPGACLLFLISRLLTCVRHKNMPHYFIKENNLIDYFSDDTQSKLLKRLWSLREFPIMAVTLLAEEHGLSSSWMADPIIRDVKQFCIHKDVQRSVTKVFIPTSFLLAEKFVTYNMYSDAAEVVVDNFKNVRSLCEVYNESLELPPLFCLIQPLLNLLNRCQQWWLCLFLDFEAEEGTLPYLTKNEEGKTIADILGDDSDGILAQTFVPYQVLAQESCPSICDWEEDSPDVDIDFMFQLTFHLRSVKDKKPCLHYLRSLVHLIKRKITDAKSIFASDKTEENVESVKTRNRVEHLNVIILYQKLYEVLTNLFETYDQEDQTELFQEFIHDLEDACDVLASRSAYRKLSNIWLDLGSQDMSQRALAKRRNLNR